MNSYLYESARDLANKIIESEEYQNYKACRCAVEEEGLQNQVDEFRTEAFRLQCQGADTYQREIGYLKERYSSILEHHAVRDYLDAEINLCRTMQIIQGILVENIDLKLDFLN
ncbi:MAG: YlbF family regulator [Lachnospiraceae bacterium]|nr:YlbF family regulator [Lachnospiraceae bacterium]